MTVAITLGPVSVSRAGQTRTERSLFRARELSVTTVLVVALGEIDAANSAELRSFVEDHVAGYQQLVLDLSRLDFFGTDGFSALHAVNVRCSRRGIDWVMVPGPEVSRALRVCDPEGSLPIATNIVSAVAALARGPLRQLQLAPLPK
ncbi:STAS domain-containing protein [Candidatus Mycolicibacterium alkanivorans]|uniref:STAS domain-containing protein n=1 Tax=Candidatus Mycolicibacterium alkanivorans TaxID=2954114 RepID=A0ABS9YS31_9MYCO|nr:STAS domain-containing protein [Candidatus Mycolicibacterium alkanivorans]MCI4673958.1 STAS domain-containing protein [Candidatus Mycolicibacterium alkanivorans]